MTAITATRRAGPASSMALIGLAPGNGLSGQLRASWPGLLHVKQSLSCFSRYGCLHSDALCPLRLQLTQVMSARPRGGIILEGRPWWAVLVLRVDVGNDHLRHGLRE